MTPIEKLRSLARMIPLDCWSSAITEVADEMERERNETIRAVIARLEQGFGHNSAPVFVIKQQFGGE